MAEYKVTLTHTEILYVEADNENEALHKAYVQAEVNCVWDEADIEELEVDQV